jgi:uncharacterized membrane protein HdeD (DUF308 family)
MPDTSPPSDPTYVQWPWFLSLGLVLIVCGIVAILLALFTPVPPSLVLARVLMIGGVFQIIHAFRVKAWKGFVWDLLLGLVQLFGGILLELDVLAGVVAIAAVLALVFLVQGLMQIALAVRVHPQDGWVWLLGSGLVALVASAGFLLKVRLIAFYTPEVMAGIAIIAAGAAYVAIGITSKRFDPGR